MKTAISRSLTAIIAVVVIILVAAGAYAAILYLPGQTNTTTQSTGSNTTATTGVAPLKMAVLLPGSIDDFGWNTAMYQAAVKLNSSNLNVQVTIVEGIGQAGPAVVSAMTDFASKGYNIVVGWTIGHQDAAIQVAPQFPHTYFLGDNWYLFGNKTNVGAVADHFWEPYYLEGIIAGSLTKTHTVGWMSGQEFPENDAIANAFILGAQSVDSSAKLKYTYVGVWDDVAQGRNVATTLINAGVDVLSCRGDGITLGAIQAASANNVTIFGDVLNQQSLAPNLMLSSSLYNDYYSLTQAASLYRSGGLFGATPATTNHYPIVLTLANGGVGLFPLNAKVIPASVIQKVTTTEQKIISGSFTVPVINTPPAAT